MQVRCCPRLSFQVKLQGPALGVGHVRIIDAGPAFEYHNGHSMDTQWPFSGHYNGHYNGHYSGHYRDVANSSICCSQSVIQRIQIVLLNVFNM